MKRRTFLSLMGAAALTSSMMLTGCGAGSGDDRKIVRIGHVQSQTHPDHLGLEAFANYINEKLGDKYRVEVYPSELLGSQTEMVQLTQTGAIDFVVASNAIMETFSAKYQIFNLPYLFSSVEAYHEAMDDPEVTDPIFKTTSKAGLETVAWLDAGTRNFYTIKTPINQPSDLKGLKIRTMDSQKPPIKVLIPGRVFRSDSDATHSPMFHQMEGLVVDKGITLCDLQGMLDRFVQALFGPEVKTRLRPSYFPFTEPSVEVDVSCFECHGKGCPLCKHSGWIEVLGAGVVHRSVLENCGIDPEVYSGFAFGIGIERIAMLKYGINNIGLMFENDLRFLEQFKG